MSNIGIKIDLTKFKHVVMEKKGQSGMVKGLFIPITANQLFEGKDGNVYADLIAFELKSPDKERSHAIKQSFPKEVREKMTQEDKDAQPFFGNLKVLGGEQSSAPNNAQPQTTFNEDDEVPF